MNGASVQSDIIMEYKNNSVVQWATCQWYQCVGICVLQHLYTKCIMYTQMHTHNPEFHCACEGHM